MSYNFYRNINTITIIVITIIELVTRNPYEEVRRCFSLFLKKDRFVNGLGLIHYYIIYEA